MSRRIGYFKQYHQIPEHPIGIAPEMYVAHDGTVTSTWYLVTGSERDTALDFKGLVALRDALNAAVEDADAAIAREVAATNKARAERNKRMSKLNLEDN